MLRHLSLQNKLGPGIPSASLCVIAIALAFSSGLKAEDGLQLRVLSYNIHHGEGIDGQLDLERIAKVIEGAKPDLVFLQEVDQTARRTKSVDQAKVLAKLTRMNFVFGGNIALQGGRYGNALLSRFPIVGHENHPLPNVNDGEQRGVLEAKINITELDDHLVVLATHFDHREPSTERFQSARMINELASKRSEPTLLAGDLNAVLGSKPINELEKFWTHTSEKSLPTVPVGKPKRQIDFILVRPQQRWSVRSTEVLKEETASDHRPILAVLTLRNTEPN